MIVHLCYRRAVTAKILYTVFIRLKYCLIAFLIVRFHPRKQSGSEVEADARIIVDDLFDYTLAIKDPGGRVRTITFGSDPFVPIVVRVCGILNFNNFQPCIFPWGLIKMSMNTDILFQILR